MLLPGKGREEGEEEAARERAGSNDLWAEEASGAKALRSEPAWLIHRMQCLLLGQ